MKKTHNPNRGRELLFKKMSRIMKLYLFILVVTVMQATASVYSQTARLNLKMEDATIAEVFDAVEKQSEFFFFYNRGQINDQQKVSVDLKNSKIDEVLTTVFGEDAVSYEIIGKNIIVKSTVSSESNSTQQTGKKVTGKVTDQSGVSLPGASVVLKGTTTGTITDNEGNFTLSNIPENATLQFTFVGMKMQEIAVGNKTTINITFEEETIGIDEIVAIGYTNARKQDLSVAVTTVKVSDNFKGRPTSLGAILQGQMTGVAVTESGDPTESSKISIRGKGNKGGDAVLYVVDGVPDAPFNPADIETVTVLKDAASAAIYGAYAGSGGVILITTKQAKEGKIAISVNGWNGVQEAWRLPEVLTSEQFNKVWKDASDAAGKTVSKTYNPALFPFGNVTRTDWIDEVFRMGKMQHYDVTLQGGTKDLKALASVSYDNIEGTLINTYNEKLTTRLNVEFKLNQWTSIRQRMTYDFSNGKSDVGDGHTGSIFGAMAYPRFSTVYDFDKAGNPVYNNAGEQMYGGTVPRWALAEGYSVEADLRNPVAMLEKVRQFNPSNRLFSNTSLEIKPLAGLTIRSDFSVDITNRRNESFQRRFLEPGRTIDQNYRVMLQFK